MGGYTVGAGGTITKDGVTIHEKGTRVLIARSIYTGTIVGGDFVGGTSYVIETDYTGMKGFGGPRRQTNAAETLLTGMAAVEALYAMKAEALKTWGPGVAVAEEFDAAIERLGDDAVTAAEKSRTGGYYRR